MGDNYAECLKSHPNLGGKNDGCQQFLSNDSSTCKACNCHRNFHRRVTPPPTFKTVYTKCQKIHDFKVPNSVDGCQEFTLSPGFANDDPPDRLYCAACRCHRAFHQTVVTKEIEPTIGTVVRSICDTFTGLGWADGGREPRYGASGWK